ncbi:phage tail tape measure protein [Virgibacillus oceani]
MSGRNLRVNLIANTSQFKSAMSETSNQMKTINSEFRNASAETDEYGNKLDNTGAKKTQLNGIIGQYETRVKAITQEQQHWTAELERGNITEEEHAQKQEELSRRLNNTEAEMKKYEGQLKRLNSEGQNTRMTYEEFDKQFRDVGKTMAKTGAAVGAATGVMFKGLTNLGKRVVTTASDFDTEMSRVQALTGATGDEFEQLEGKALELGSSTVFGASEAADAMGFLGMAGFDTNQILEATPALLDLAAAAQMDLGRAADITSNIISGFNYEAEEAGRVSDVLASASSNANTNVEQMGDAMATVAPIASTLGMDIEDLSSGVMVMSDAGIQGQKSGRQLRQGLIRLSKPTGEASDLIEELGINVFDADGNMKSLDGVVAELEDGLDGMSSQAETAALATLFGSESTAGWSALLKQGSGVLADYTTDLQNSEGAASDMAETMQDNLQGSVTELKSAFEGLQIELGQKLIPYVRDGVDWLTEFTQSLVDMDSETVEAIAKTALMATGVLGVTTAVAGLVAGIGALMAFAGPIGVAIVGGTALLGGLATALYGIEQHTKAVEESQREAKREALNYGENLSEGTQTGVKAYTDLYEHAKIKMVELRTMSGDEAEATKEELRQAFADMADVVIAELEQQKDELTRVVNEIYGSVGEAGAARSEQITDDIIETIDSEIAEYRRARDTINEIIDEYGANWADYPEKVQKAYDEAYLIMDEGAGVFAQTQREMQAIQERIIDQGGAIQNDQVEEFIGRINETFDGSLEAIQQHYSDKKSVMDQALAQEHIDAETHAEMLKGLEQMTTGMYEDAASQRNDALQELAGHVDKRGELIDLESGKILERGKVEEELSTTGRRVARERDETDEEYFDRWLKRQEDYLANTEKFASDTNRVANEQQIEFLESLGYTYEEALILMDELNRDSTEALSEGAEEAMEAGKAKGDHYIMGLDETIPGAQRSADEIVEAHNVRIRESQEETESLGKASGDHYIKGLDSTTSQARNAAEQFSNASNEGIGTGDETSEQHGKDKGDAHRKGLDGTREANNHSGREFSKRTLQGIGEGNTESENAGKNKGDAHRSGLESTQSNNEASANRLTAGVTRILGSTTDGGGGSKAGREFRGGLTGWNGQVEAAGAGIARSGRDGLASVDTSGTGRNFVSGFRNNINDNNGSIWNRAWNLGRTALSALNSSIRTASPSRETEETGENFIAGFANSIDKGRKETAEKASLVGKDALESLNKELQGYKQAISGIAMAVGSNKQTLKVEHEIKHTGLEDKLDQLLELLAKERMEKNSSSGVTQNITINSPEPTSPSENARKLKQASRHLALEWR